MSALINEFCAEKFLETVPWAQTVFYLKNFGSKLNL